MALEDEVRALTEQIKQMIGTGGPKINTGQQIVGNIANTFNNVTDSMAKLTFGTYNLQAGLGDFSKIVSAVGGSIGTGFGDMIKKIGSEAIYLNTALNDAGKSGVNFNNNLGDYASALGSARISVPQFSQILLENGSKIAGMSGNAQKSAEQFLATGKLFQESQAVRQLEATGVGAEELNKVLTISAINRRNLDFADERVRIRAAAAAADMATEMDNVARLTGVSRQEQEKAIQAQLKKNEVEIMLASMSEGERSAYEKSTTELGRYGKQFQDVLTIYATGGVRNAEDNAKVAAMGPKFAGLLEQMAAIKGNTAEDQTNRRRIQAEIDAEALRISKNPEELRMRAANTTSAGEWGRAQGQVTVDILRYGATLQQAQRDLDAENKKRAPDKQITLDQLLDERVKEEARKRAEAEKSTQPGALINRAEILIKDASAGVSSGFKDLNTETKKLIDTSFLGLNAALRPFTTEGAKDAFKNMVRGANPNPENVDNSSDRVKADAAKKKAASAQTQENAGGGDYMAGMFQVRGELGIEVDKSDRGGKTVSNDQLRSLFGSKDTDIRNTLSSLNTSISTQLAESKASMPTLAQFEQLIDRVNISKAPTTMSMPTDSTNTMLVDGFKELNTLVKQLIAATVDGTDRSVRAVKTSTSGNMLA
jgi:hypothetical protein